jgi:hypothetical protein
MKDILPMHF